MPHARAVVPQQLLGENKVQGLGYKRIVILPNQNQNFKRKKSFQLTEQQILKIIILVRLTKHRTFQIKDSARLTEHQIFGN